MKILCEAAQGIGQFLREQGYTEENLSRLGLAESSRSNQDLFSAVETIVHDGDDQLDLPSVLCRPGVGNGLLR
jgi:hypothetical protein